MIDDIPVKELDGISIIPRDDGDFVLAIVDKDGTVTARHASRNKLTQMFGYIGNALEPGLLTDHLAL